MIYSLRPMHTEETRVVFKFNECKTSLIDNSDLGFSLKSICRGGGRFTYNPVTVLAVLIGLMYGGSYVSCGSTPLNPCDKSSAGLEHHIKHVSFADGLELTTAELFGSSSLSAKLHRRRVYKRRLPNYALFCASLSWPNHTVCTTRR